MTRGRKKHFSFFLWHRRLGLVALLLVVILSITGLMLNHTESLSLDESHVEADWLLDWYGLNPRSEAKSFSAGDHVITQWDQQLFFNQQPLIQSPQSLRGASLVSGIIAIALQHSIILLDENGELIEQVDTRTEFPAIEKIGLANNRLVVLATNNHYFAADQQIIKWTATSDAGIQWSQTATLTDELRQSLLEAYRGDGLTLERVILDLHSGRLFSASWGVYIMDASAIIMLWLGFSGTWVWLSRKHKMKTKRHYQKRHPS